MTGGRKLFGIALGIGIIVGLALGLVVGGRRAGSPARAPADAATLGSQTTAEQRPRPDPSVVTVDDAQAQRLKIEPVQLHSFRDERTAVGRIAYNDEGTTSIFAPFQGRVLRLIAKPGDALRRGSPLLVLDSPDLVQANADLIAASVAVRKAQNQLTQAERVATRQRLLYEAGAGAYKDFEQADSDVRNAQNDLKTAEGQLTGARNRLRAPFGKDDAAIARIETTHEVDRTAQILSPITGTVTARKVSPDQFVRADNTDAMYSIADVSSMWLIANVAEIDIPRIKLGQEVAVRVMAYPGEVFRARIAYVGASVDPAVRRLTVRAEIDNRDGRLKPDMFASFRILTGAPTESPGVPVGAIVREGDGTMTAWVTTDRKRLTRRTVRLGLRQDGLDQVLEGLQPGELVATEATLFLGNILTFPGASE